MKVEAALILFRRSLEKHGFRYTNIFGDGDCMIYLALCQDETNGFIKFTKEDSINHVEKKNHHIPAWCDHKGEEVATGW